MCVSRAGRVAVGGGARGAGRVWIGSDYGAADLPDEARRYRVRAKNAQEAHEAIRPTGFDRRPADIGRRLDDDQRRLYALIWKRAVACQMMPAVLDQVAVDIASPDRPVVLRATGPGIAFDGDPQVSREGPDVHAHALCPRRGSLMVRFGSPSRSLTGSRP